MKTKLSFVLLSFLLLAMHFLITGFQLNGNTNDSAEPRRLKYLYVVETDLSVREFFDVFCGRLIAKYNWYKVSANLSGDEIYTGIFSFRDNSKNSWRCEVKIKKVKNTSNKISVEIVMSPFLES